MVGLVLAGCFHPTYDHLRCGPDRDCPSGLSCNAELFCETSSTPNAPGGDDACTLLACHVADCGAQGLSATTLTGTVFAPNGTLPLYGVHVYVPDHDPGPLPAGVQCGTCAAPLPGEPVVQTTTDEAGNFALRDVPAGVDIPVVIAIGKWRRVLRLARVDACQTLALAAADTTLPKSRDDLTPSTTSVDMPRIALSTGGADALECLLRKIGIADQEFTTDQQGGAVQLFADFNAGSGLGTSAFSTGFAGGTGMFGDSTTLWGTATDPGKLANYDVVILSCEGGQHLETKSQEAMNHLKAYADSGGRVFLSHWHNVWIEGNLSGAGPAPQVWPLLATWSNNSTNSPTTDTIDEVHNPKGMSFATWMVNVNGTLANQRDSLALVTATGKNTCAKLNDDTQVEQWIYWQQDASTQLPQAFQFATPFEGAARDRCGKVVFSDVHVANGPMRTGGGILPYPESCGANANLSTSDKATAFMLFDMASCVGAPR